MQPQGPHYPPKTCKIQHRSAFFSHFHPVRVTYPIDKLESVRHMLNVIKRRINRWRFKYSIGKLKNTEFCNIANNCLGSRIYQTLGRQYNTPFVGLLVPPPCFAKLVADFESYMAKELTFSKESKYPNHPNARRTNKPCPIGRLGDIELQFIHYSSEDEAAKKWNQRKARINYTKLHYILVIGNIDEPEIIATYTQSNTQNKVCFHIQKELEFPTGVYIPPKKNHIGNLYSQYHRLVGHFDFAQWILRSNQPKDPN